MGERTEYAPGTFCFADVGTRDPEASAAFYTALFGWDASDTPGAYTMFELRGKPVAGMFEAPEDFAPAWLSYISVEDGAATAAAVRSAGGSVLLEPRPVSEQADVGQTALIADPQGALVALWQPGAHKGAGLVNEEGTLVWNGLSTSDVPAAQGFYGSLFGWTYEVLGGTEDDPYWEIRNREGWLNGGIAGLPAPGVPPSWLVTFTAADADAAVARVEELGGAVVQPAADVPIGRFAVVADPAGVMFSLFQGDVDA